MTNAMNVSEKSLEFECPVCRAKPRKECHRIDGQVMPLTHRARRNLVLGKHPTRPGGSKPRGRKPWYLT